MKKIELKFQLALFGNFDDIIPNVDTIKYFLEEFSDKGLIPNQYHEVSIDPATGTSSNGNRLNLTSSDQSWNVRFGFDRMDILLSNTNVEVTEMLSQAKFIEECIGILNVINTKFPKKVKRIGFVIQHLIADIELSQVVDKFSKPTNFHHESGAIEFHNKIASRSSIKIPEDEIMNVSSELRWLNTNFKMENKYSPLNGLLFTTDVNTILENNDYRFDLDRIKNVVKESSKITNTLAEQYFVILEQN